MLKSRKNGIVLQFKKNIWLIYNVFLAIGLVYLVATAYSRWEEIRQPHYQENIVDKPDILLELQHNSIFSGI